MRSAMRSFIIATVASFALTAAACAVATWAMWGPAHVDARAASLHAAHHIRSLPLWIPG